MTDQQRDNDEALADRIRRSMAHYRFERDIPSPPTHASAWRWPMLAGAVLAGAAAATLAITLLGGLPRGLIGTDNSPTPTPINAAQADAACRAGPHEIQDGWAEPGESDADVTARLRLLPLVHEDQRAHAALFMYADDRFTIECIVQRQAGASGEVQRSVGINLREPDGGGLEYSGGAVSPVVPGSLQPPDLYMFGTVDQRFTRIEVVLADGGAVDAWLGDGLWLAWWNDPISSVAVRGYDRDGTVSSLAEGLAYHPQPTTEPQPSPVPTPWPGLPVTVDQMQRFCGTDSTPVPSEWRRPGETLAQVLDQLRRLPPIIVEVRDFAGGYLFADDRFVVACRLYRTSSGEPERNVLQTLREDPGDGLIYSFGSARADVPQADGSSVADMLMVGSAALRIERVEVLLEDGSIVAASLEDGMWLAWWNVPLASVEVRGYDASGRPTVIQAGIAPALSPSD